MRILLAGLLVLLAQPASAAATGWQEVAPEARMRLVSADALAPDGTLQVGVEIDMPATTKTYWRVPGETGIPARFDFSGSKGIGDHTVHWPYPAMDQSTGYLDFVYWGPTVIPVTLATTGEPITLRLDMILGICSDICVPVTATFDLPISTVKPDAGQSIRIEQALANVPLPAADDPGIGAPALAAEELAIPITGAGIDPGSIIAATADPAVLFGAPQKSPETDLVLLPLLGGEQQALVGQVVEIHFMTPDGPYFVERTIVADESTPAVR